jgi:hypothetical protein
MPSPKAHKRYERSPTDAVVYERTTVVHLMEAQPNMNDQERQTRFWLLAQKRLTLDILLKGTEAQNRTLDEAEKDPDLHPLVKELIELCRSLAKEVVRTTGAQSIDHTLKTSE